MRYKPNDSKTSPQRQNGAVRVLVLRGHAPAARRPRRHSPSIGAHQAASQSDKPSPADAPSKKSSPELQERSQAFMQIAPSAVPAVIEGATEQISPKYRNLTEAYYKAVAAAGSHDR